VEYLGPVLELARTGSPYLAGGGIALTLAGIFLREVRRHYAAELQTWSERYAELQDRHEKTEAKRDEYLAAWLKAERELSDVARTTRQTVQEVGGS
jgi:hypothetical protein